jgi:hypothetical protein
MATKPSPALLIHLTSGQTITVPYAVKDAEAARHAGAMLEEQMRKNPHQLVAIAPTNPGTEPFIWICLDRVAAWQVTHPPR